MGETNSKTHKHETHNATPDAQTKSKKDKPKDKHPHTDHGQTGNDKQANPKKIKSPKENKTQLERLKHSPNDDINKYYEIKQMIGKGNFSTVMKGIDKETGETVAIKVINKVSVKHKPEMLQNEVDILRKVDHPNIIKLLDLFETDKSLYLVMELVSGGELFDRIVEKEQYSEKDAKEVMKSLFSAIEYLHSNGIVHRDLKPENLLLESEQSDTKIKITDFGLSKIFTTEFMDTACGTPGYVAPEILNCSGYDTAVDMWAAGVIMYILLCGYPPFYSEKEQELFESILEANYHFHSPYWDEISTEAKNLIKKLLVVDPKKRLTPAQALDDPWIKGNSAASAQPLPNKMKEELKKHNEDRKSRIDINISTNKVKK